MVTHKRAQKIRQTFERQLKTDEPQGIDEFTLAELEQVLVHYAGRDEGAPFKVLIQQRIDRRVYVRRLILGSLITLGIVLVGGIILGT